MASDFNESLIGLLPNLRRFAISLCRSADLADDLVQQTCQKAISARDSYRTDTRMEAWLFRILHNTWIDTLRRRHTEGYPVDVDEAPDLLGFDGAADMDHRLILQRAFRHIDALPEQQRQVLLLVCVEELSYRETSEILDIPIGTVMSRLTRARKKLAEGMGIIDGTARNPSREGEVT